MDARNFVNDQDLVFNENDPFGLVCTQCGYISFYVTLMTLTAIIETVEKIRLYKAKKQDQDAQAQQGQNAPPIKKKRSFLSF